MIKTILVLENGMEIMAGESQVNAIQSVSIEESCNDGEDLTLGSVCAKMISAKIITPSNKLPIAAGEKIIVLEEENGERRKKGHFIAEKPQKKGANTTNVIAFDNISLLDKDITVWFNALDGFPYTAYNMAKMACEHCGVSLANSDIPNGDFLINDTKLSSVTGRQIIRWIGEICGCFCVADENGNAFYRWYEKNETHIVATRSQDSVIFLQGGLSYEDYEVKKIDRVQIREDAEDAGLSYPEDIDGGNAYIIQSNPFLMNGDTEQIKTVAQKLYEVIGDIVYTPCKVSIPSSFVFNVGDIAEIQDANGVKISIYIMRKIRKGHKETLECTGNYERNGATSIYSTSFEDNYGKTLKIEKKIGELSIAATAAQESIARVEIKVDDNAASVKSIASVQTEQGKNIASISQQASDLEAEVVIVAEKATNAENNVSNGAYIIARINEDGSIVKISAEKLELSGYATFASLENEGTTSINGANIMTGTVDADVLKTGGVGQTGTMLGNNLMFNAGAVKYSDAEARYLFFVDPALYNVFIGVEGGSDANILRIHSEGNGLFDSYGGERLYLGSIKPGNEFVTRGEVQRMIVDALSGMTTLSAPEAYMDGTDGYSFTITNLNGYGDIVYWTIWEDASSGETGVSQTMRSSSNVVTGYVDEFPPSSGIVGVEAYIEYNGYYSDTSRDTQDYA